MVEDQKSILNLYWWKCTDKFYTDWWKCTDKFSTDILICPVAPIEMCDLTNLLLSNKFPAQTPDAQEMCGGVGKGVSIISFTFTKN